jgi:superoxide reductase|tara:strand:- start:381 stop:767 length:387 start_codon:yes stop_codon:yes gene_type:complete
MTKQDKIYKCSICGNVVSVLEAHAGILSCCDKPMVLQEEKTGEQEGKEKHVPVIEKTDNGILVKVGSIPHPMEDGHYIELVQLIKEDGVVIGKRLKPGDKPEAEFCCLAEVEGLKARIFCNLHGAWTN